MSVLSTRIQKILNTPTLCGLSTITTDGKPWVRYVMAQATENLLIRFPTHMTDRKVEQIKLNNEVHLTCGINDPSIIKPYLQIQGTARLVQEKETKHNLWNEDMGKVFKGPDDENYGVIEVTPYRIELCEIGKAAPEIFETNEAIEPA